MDRRATATRRATVQAKPSPGDHTKPGKKRALRDIRVSRFMITVNTNQTWDGDEALAKSQDFADVLDSIGFDGSTCALWGKFFMVSKFKGKRWSDPKQKDKLPKYDSSYVDPYQEDDKGTEEDWCNLIEALHVDSAGVEWGKGTKRGKNQYLHAHLMVSVQHRTRLMVNGAEVAKFFQHAMNMPHLPYVHVDWINDATARAIEYTLKHAMAYTSESVRDMSEKFFKF